LEFGQLLIGFQFKSLQDKKTSTKFNNTYTK
jgi:hypothetical protein